LEICTAIGAKFEIVRGLLVEAKVLIGAGKQEEAATILWKAVTRSRECQLEKEEAVAQELLATLKNIS